MAPTALDGAPAPQMCARPYPDVVSDALKANGAWQDCLLLSDLWKLSDRSQGNSSYDPCPSASHPRPTVQKLYVDIGANIGSCLLQMMAREDVPHGVAFEPNPANLFYLTSSILATPGTAQKLTLYPDALGSHFESHMLYEEPGNAGNTVLDKPIHGSRMLAGEVITRTLDDVFMSSSKPPYIHLMKIDAQGFEVEILKGASKLLASRSINAVKFEVAADWLAAQNTSVAEYLNIFMGSGFDIYTGAPSSTAMPMTDQELHDVACRPPHSKPDFQDFVAYLKQGEIKANANIQC
eukprot:gnl/TRDRNA2_/TRDRNA2_66988_c0_seq1.p1 gnl/TRDRNA2_/TRDRNA2_66988_c0~~gnl/TRDRNA2_/TRDRNA2_66988_c0_seq1.p1  ORF type:complete len:325 (+),score=44.65 gnl/TRDRNA2_/TRDRNA2_66988_c0_seq1:95-976(+)